MAYYSKTPTLPKKHCQSITNVHSSKKSSSNTQIINLDTISIIPIKRKKDHVWLNNEYLSNRLKEKKQSIEALRKKKNTMTGIVAELEKKIHDMLEINEINPRSRFKNKNNYKSLVKDLERMIEIKMKNLSLARGNNKMIQKEYEELNEKMAMQDQLDVLKEKIEEVRKENYNYLTRIRERRGVLFDMKKNDNEYSVENNNNSTVINTFKSINRKDSNRDYYNRKYQKNAMVMKEYQERLEEMKRKIDYYYEVSLEENNSNDKQVISEIRNQCNLLYEALNNNTPEELLSKGTIINDDKDNDKDNDSKSSKAQSIISRNTNKPQYKIDSNTDWISPMTNDEDLESTNEKNLFDKKLTIKFIPKNLKHISINNANQTKSFISKRYLIKGHNNSQTIIPRHQNALTTMTRNINPITTTASNNNNNSLIKDSMLKRELNELLQQNNLLLTQITSITNDSTLKINQLQSLNHSYQLKLTSLIQNNTDLQKEIDSLIKLSSPLAHYKPFPNYIS